MILVLTSVLILQDKYRENKKSDLLHSQLFGPGFTFEGN